MSLGPLTALPATAMITSPGTSPAAAAGAPGTTPTIVAPWPPKEGPFPSCTPRNAVAPMCTVADDLPETICFAIVVALPMGIA